jgi:hypothetical protein
MSFKIIRLDSKIRTRYETQIRALEENTIYPLGPDSFRISHGNDYFAFFDRLGETRFYIALHDDQVVAVGCGILRTLPFRIGEKPRKVWYICDLKVRPDFRGQHIPLKIAWRGFLLEKYRFLPFYGISMNQEGHAENRVFRLAKKFPLLPIRQGGILEIFSFSKSEMELCLGLIQETRHPSQTQISFLSLKGKKDLILNSTNAPMRLLHLLTEPAHPGQQQLESEKNLRVPQADTVHMLCSIKDGLLSKKLKQLGLSPSASATIIHHRMSTSDWHFISTGEI